MSFDSFEFIIFFVLVFIGNYITQQKYRWFILLVASSVFIGYFSIPFLIYTYIFSAFNYFWGILVDRQEDMKKRKLFYQIGVVIDVGLLAYFKYFNFILENVNELLGFIWSDVQIPLVRNVIIPLGISFYTFSSIGYIINIYRKQEKAERHFGLFALFILYFPKFVSGPVERSKKFFPQFKKQEDFYGGDIYDGLRQVLWGAFKKLVIADRLGLLINGVYGNLDEYSGIPLIMVMFLQTIHIYCDFSGYTDIALGLSKTLGYKLTPNFERPFFAQNVSMLWRKWHISLSSWCNDYIFMQTLFNRRKWKNWAALYGVFVTFTIIGIWHGPRWNYVILGLLQVLAINYEFFTKKKRIEVSKKFNQLWVRRISRIITISFFSFSLIFFNAVEVKDATYFIGHMFKDWNLNFLDQNLFINFKDAAIIVIAFIFVFWYETKEEKGWDMALKFKSLPVWLKYTIYYIIIFLVLYSAGNQNQFVYQQF